MRKHIFVNLTVKDLARRRAFFSSLEDHGFMYGHGFEDLDGHLWELSRMDPGMPPPHA